MLIRVTKEVVVVPKKADSKDKSKPKSKWERSDSYRSDFLKRNKGFFGCLYFCVYCGRPITRKNMQVDHHIAINFVKQNPLLKLYFGTANIITNIFGSIVYGKDWKKNKGVNVSYNLVPACEKCNKAKSDKGGTWIIRGLVGGTIWKILNFVNNILFALLKPPFGPIILIGGLAALLIFTPVGSYITALFG